MSTPLNLHGKVIRARRKARDWTVGELALLASMGEKTLQRIESGKRKLYDHELVTLAQILKFAPYAHLEPFQKALEHLGNLPQAKQWFTTPQKTLHGCTPLEACTTEAGALEVEQLLGRIEHGIFSKVEMFPDQK